MSESDERLFAMLIYLLSFFAPLLGPLLIWLIKRDQSEFVDFHGKQYLNFMISFTIYGIVSGILVIVLIGILLIIAAGILAFIFTLIALFKAFNGERYRIPLAIPFIK